MTKDKAPKIEKAESDLIYRLRKRAEIRRQIPGRRSVQEGAPDRIADLLEEAATEIERLHENVAELERIANEWMRDYDRIKNKYEPLVAVLSAPTGEEHGDD